jgi:hypothetical protein
MAVLGRTATMPSGIINALKLTVPVGVYVAELPRKVARYKRRDAVPGGYDLGSILATLLLQGMSHSRALSSAVALSRKPAFHFRVVR